MPESFLTLIASSPEQDEICPEENRPADIPRNAADIADSHARHYAAILSHEEPDSPHWRFLLGQLSAAATLANVLRGAESVSPVVNEP